MRQVPRCSGEIAEKLLLRVEIREELPDGSLLKRRVILVGDSPQVRGDNGRRRGRSQLGQVGEQAVPLDPVGAGTLSGELLYQAVEKV